MCIIVLLLFTGMKVYAYDFRSGGIYYKIIGNNVDVTNGDTEYEGDIVIPNEVANDGKTYKVTGIGNSVFYGCSGLTSITIPSSVTFIATNAFSKCSGLTSRKVESGNKKYDSRNSCNAIIETSSNTLIAGCKNTMIPSSVTSIGSTAFQGCSGLTSILIPSSVTSIGAVAFAGCSGLTSITIPSSVTSIGYRAFWFCSGLTSITIPSSVTSIDDGAFSDCSSLYDIISDIKTPFEIKENVFSVYSTATLTVPNGTKAAYQSTAGWNKFTNIVESTNSSDNTGSKRTIHVATAGTLPNLISESEKYTIEELILTGELNGTDFRLLRDMAGNNYLGQNTSGKLKVLDLTNAKVVAGGEKYLDTNTIRGNGVDANGSYHYDILQNNEIPQAVFFGCYLRDIHSPNTVTSIKESAFKYCRDLSSITIPNSVTSIGNEAFDGCRSLTSISIPNSVTNIGNYAFWGCSGLTSISIPNSVTSIGISAFSDCSGLTSISIPNSVTSIGFSAFEGCNSLTSISIPNSVTSIGNGAFRGCSGLTSIKVESGNTVYDSRNNCNAIIKMYNDELIAGCKNTVIPNSVTSIGSYAFEGCSGLTSISIPNSVTSIRSSAFSNCSGLTSISIPNSVTSIGNYAFYYCSGLTSISIPNSVTSIGNDAFSGCSGLTSISIPNSVTIIGSNAFYYCRGLKDVISEIKTPFEISENVFSVYSTAKLTVPKGTKSAYQSTNYWNKFTTIVEKETGTIIQGDANGDQEVNVSDIVEVVNYINNNASEIFIISNADLNGDGEVNVTDIVWMVNIIMSVQSSSVRTMSNRAGNITDGDCLTIDDVNINAGETKSVSISLNNPDKKYTAFQFDLTLPKGIAIAKNSNGKLMASLDAERKDDHTLSVSEFGNNTYRFLAFSMSNAELYGTSGPLVNITLVADADMSNGTNAAALKSQVFTATDGTQYKWSDLQFSIQVNENTGIDKISLNGQKDGMIKVYTLTGLLLFSIPHNEFAEKWQALPSGVYIVNGQKMIKSDDTK